MPETLQTTLRVMIALCFLVILIWPDFWRMTLILR